MVHGAQRKYYRSSLRCSMLPSYVTQVDVHEPKEMLGVWGCPAGDDTKHLEEKVVGRVAKWITRTKNGHLPSKFAWVSYRFKLWAGVRYGLATLATPLSIAQELLRDSEFKMLSFLRVNKNIKREWRTLRLVHLAALVFLASL